jgi:hypothetical protein
MKAVKNETGLDGFAQGRLHRPGVHGVANGW